MLNGSTSPAYVLQSAFFMRLVGPDFGPTAIQISNVALTMIGVFLAWRAVPGRRVLALRGALLLCLLALSPPALLISYAGMETALLIILLGGLLKGVVEDLSVYSIAAALLLPWVRIDSIVFTGCLAAAMWIASPAARRTATLLVTTQLVATGLALGVHQFYFGQPLPQSIIGKFTTYQPVARSLSLRLHGVREALSQVFCPFDTHYLKTPWVVVTLAIAGACIVLVWALLRWRDGDSNGRFLALGIPGWIVLPILAYGSSSYVFAWYLWPSAFFFFLVATDLLGRLLASRRGVWVSLLVVAAGLLMFSGQLVLAYQNGAEEYRYRREVGLWIRDNSPPSASILLEPIGYIGYFSNRYIHDWTGLISPSVVAYRRLHGSGWMPVCCPGGHRVRRGLPSATLSCDSRR
jgi:hypothetical protein